MAAEPKRTILLMDNQRGVLPALHNYLEKHGYNLLEAQDGDEAELIAQCYAGMIQALVTDLSAPWLDLVRRLQLLRPDMQVILTSKPFRPKRLLNAIEEALADPKPERTVAGLVQPLTMANRM